MNELNAKVYIMWFLIIFLIDSKTINIWNTQLDVINKK